MNTNKLTQLANQYGYNSVNQMCRQNKVDPQRLWTMVGNKNRPDTIERIAKELKVKTKDLAAVLKMEYLVKFVQENKLSVAELEELFVEAAKK